MEQFGVGKEQSEEEIISEDLQSLLLINHDLSADVLSLKSYERKHLSDDVLNVFFIHSPQYPPFAAKSVVMYGKHRYNVPSVLRFDG